jgi:hypothetical protein
VLVEVTVIVGAGVSNMFGKILTFFKIWGNSFWTVLILLLLANNFEPSNFLPDFGLFFNPII